MTLEDIVEKLALSVAEGDEDRVKQVANEIIQRNLDPAIAIDKGLTKGILTVGERWTRGEAFITEVIIVANAFKVGLEVLEPKLKEKGGKLKTVGRFLIGTVQGDIHDIGKNIVGAMLRAAGFDVRDLGVDVPRDKFVEEAKQFNTDIIGLSSLLTTSMPEQRNVIEAFKQANLRDKVKVMVGGTSVTNEWVQEIEADARGVDALDAVKKAKALLGR